MTRFVYVGGGTYIDGGHIPHGIQVFRMDPESGKMEQVHSVESGPNPTFLAMDASRRVLFAVNETNDGAASAFAVDPATGGLAFVNRMKVGGNSPCYISLDPGGRWLVAANYSSGSLSVLPVGRSGRLGERVQVVTHEGCSSDTQRRLASRDEQGPLAAVQLPGAGETLPGGVRPERQERAHAHCAVFDPVQGLVLAADLGQDRIWVYRQGADGRLAPLSDRPEWTEYGWIGAGIDPAERDRQASAHGKPRAGHSLRPGAGPRHLAFHPNGQYLYVSTELGSTVTVFRWDAETGDLLPLQELSTLPADYTGRNDVAHLELTPDGRFLYVSNRGHDSLAAFRVDADTGLLAPAGHFSTQGNWPRNFGIAPDGRFLLAANQNSGSVVVLRIDPRTGALEDTGISVQVPMPMFVKAVDL